MNSTPYLYAAYIAAGVIHLSYLWTVASRYLRVRKKMRALNKPV